MKDNEKIPSAEINLREDTLNAIRSGVDSAVDLFLEDLMDQEQKIVGILNDYAYEKDPLGTVHQIDDTDDLEISIDGEGTILINYTVNVYSGCRDINMDYDDEEVYLNIEVDFEGKTAMFTGPPLMPVREPDEF